MIFGWSCFKVRFGLVMSTNKYNKGIMESKIRTCLREIWQRDFWDMGVWPALRRLSVRHFSCVCQLLSQAASPEQDWFCV